MYFRNSRGEWFRRGAGGTYPVNDGDPQNQDDEFDRERAEQEQERQREARDGTVTS